MTGPDYLTAGDVTDLAAELRLGLSPPDSMCLRDGLGCVHDDLAEDVKVGRHAEQDASARDEDEKLAVGRPRGRCDAVRHTAGRIPLRRQMKMKIADSHQASKLCMYVCVCVCVCVFIFREGILATLSYSGVLQPIRFRAKKLGCVCVCVL